MVAELAFTMVAVGLALPGLVVLIFELSSGASREKAADPLPRAEADAELLHNDAHTGSVRLV